MFGYVKYNLQINREIEVGTSSKPFYEKSFPCIIWVIAMKAYFNENIMIKNSYFSNSTHFHYHIQELKNKKRKKSF